MGTKPVTRDGAFRQEVDAFLAEPKIPALPAPEVTWGDARDRYKRRLTIPLSVHDEFAPGATLVIDARVDGRPGEFNIVVTCMHVAVSRLDHEFDVDHANPSGELICGPHWHGWPMNRERAKLNNRHADLPFAEPFVAARQFDACLRWVCQQTGVVLGHHDIELPPQERLL